MPEVGEHHLLREVARVAIFNVNIGFLGWFNSIDLILVKLDLLVVILQCPTSLSSMLRLLTLSNQFK